MIIPFSDFATRSLRRRTGVYWSAQGCWKGCSRHESTQLVLVSVLFLSEDVSSAINPQVAIAAWHCLVLNNAGTLTNCSLAWLNIKSHLNGWMISTIRQHFEGILVLFHSGSGQEEESDEGDDASALYILSMWCWTTSLCFYGRRESKGYHCYEIRRSATSYLMCFVQVCQLHSDNTRSAHHRSTVYSLFCYAGRAGPPWW